MTDTTKSYRNNPQLVQDALAIMNAAAAMLAKMGRDSKDANLEVLGEIVISAIENYDFPEDSDESNTQGFEGGAE